MPRNNGRRKLHGRFFLFLELPVDLQLLTLGFLDLQTLHSAIWASVSIANVYKLHPESLIISTTQYMGKQVQNLMLATLDITHGIAWPRPGFGPNILDMAKYFADVLDGQKPKNIFVASDGPLRTLKNLSALEGEVSELVESYSHDAYARACTHDNPGAVPPPLILSPSESHRIHRAFWRLKLYGVLFYDYAARFNLGLSASYSAFFDRLSAFEMDEMNTVYQYMIRYRFYFTSVLPHKDCPFKGKAPGRNRDPFECPDCQGRSMYGERNMHWLDQAFWHIFERRYLLRRPWAMLNVCRSMPVKMWRDVPESNFPNAGWEQTRLLRLASNLTEEEYIVRYRNLGYCFWDEERLQGWDFFELRSDDYERAEIEW